MEEVKSPQVQRANEASEPIDVVDRNGRPRSVRDHDKENSKQKSEGSTKPSATGSHDAAEPFGDSYNMAMMLCSMKQIGAIGLSSEFVSSLDVPGLVSKFGLCRA